jgi:molybdenum cofactor biosynthesis enzyme MoaA
MFPSMKPLITKAEVLLTRRCNIKCGTCAVIEPALDPVTGKPTSQHLIKEMTTSEWKEAFDVVYDNLGGTFVALYGGEPLVYGDDKLVEIIKILSAKRSDVCDFTIISNGIGLTSERAKRFVDAGLQSWTSSVDTSQAGSDIGDRYMNAKTPAGLKALAMMKNEFNLRDTCGIVTVTAKNLDEIIPTVEWLSANGHWVGIDLLHWNRGDGEYTFSSEKQAMDYLGLTLTEEHMEKLSHIADHIISRHSDLLVFPTKRVLEMWKDPKFSVELTWKCQPGHAITIDSNGQIGLCDDRMPNRYGEERKKLLPEGRPWHILDFNKKDELLPKWKEFLSWYAKDLNHCMGCAWSTHVMAVDALNNQELRSHYVHKTTPAQLTS